MTTRVLVLLTVASCAFAAGVPRIVFTKSFPGSSPAYMGITVDRNGQASYKEDPNDDDPYTFQLEDQATSAIFDLAAKLDHFDHPLESGLKVANMGVKTFRWEDGAQSSQEKYNHTLDKSAEELQDWFERIGESERTYIALDRAIKHDRLGVNDALLRLQSEWDHKQLVGGAQFLPLLDHIVKDDAYIHIAQERAASLAQALRAAGEGKPQ
jgi:hypothetical protein